MDKTSQYEKLVIKRKSFTFLDKELTNPSKTIFDINEIEPWAQWQNNLDAKILLIGQEYCDLDTYNNVQAKVERFPNKYEYPANKNLNEYFKILEYDIGHPLVPNKNNPIFFTNAVMGLKTPPMSANFKISWLKESRNEFLIPLINIIKPQIIITVGSMAIKTIGAIYNFKVNSLAQMVANSPICLPEKNIMIFPVFHTGGLGLSNRKKELQIEDWKNIKKHL